jgi:hypothetical protein
VRKARSPRRRGSSSAGYSCRRGHAERAARYCRPEYPTYDPDSVALPGPARRALVLVGSDVLGNFELHQLLSHGPHALAQEVDVLVELGLAQQLLKRHLKSSATGWFPLSEIKTIPMGTAGGRLRHRPMSKVHTSRDSTGWWGWGHPVATLQVRWAARPHMCHFHRLFESQRPAIGHRRLGRNMAGAPPSAARARKLGTRAAKRCCDANPVV